MLLLIAFSVLAFGVWLGVVPAKRWYHEIYARIIGLYIRVSIDIRDNLRKIIGG